MDNEKWLLNTKKSLDVFFSSNYSATGVEYMGTVLNKSTLSEWVRFAFAGPDGRPAGRLNNKDAIFETMIVDIGCFVKWPSTNAARIWEIAGEVNKALERKDIPLRDYDTVGNDICGYLRGQEASVDHFGINAELGFQVEQLTVSISFTWHETRE